MDKITLNHIAGYEIEKQEALKVINFLKNYEEYITQGITLPKGLLLSGNPGVGKTLLAKAIANESDANFIEFKNNDDSIVENIRNTFSKAKQMIPSILFIDELDEIVTNTYGEITDLQKKTLQTLLTEIDGLNGSEGVIVIATCNHKSNIPEALLRSGRIEKHMTLGMPSYDARCKIFDLYMSKHQMLDSIDRELLAKKSNGLTGADINNLTNEVLLECKSLNSTPTLDDFERYIPVVLFKDIRRQNDDDSIQYVAAHEMGHFICTYVLKKEIASISIEKYANVAGFVVRQRQRMEFSKLSTLMDDLTILLGGLAGEKVILNDMTTGSSSDIDKAYSIISNIINVGAFGFQYYKSEKFSYGDTEKISDISLKQREDKISSLLNECLTRAESIIKDNKHIYDLLIEELLKERRLSSERITQVFKENCIK